MFFIKNVTDVVILYVTLLTVFGFFFRNKLTYWVMNVSLWGIFGLAFATNNLEVLKFGLNVTHFTKSWRLVFVFIFVSFLVYLGGQMKKGLVKKNPLQIAFFIYNATVVPFTLFFAPLFIGFVGLSLAYNVDFFDWEDELEVA